MRWAGRGRSLGRAALGRHVAACQAAYDTAHAAGPTSAPVLATPPATPMRPSAAEAAAPPHSPGADDHGADSALTTTAFEASSPHGSVDVLPPSILVPELAPPLPSPVRLGTPWRPPTATRSPLPARPAMTFLQTDLVDLKWSDVPALLAEYKELAAIVEDVYRE